MQSLQRLLRNLRTSFWFVPSLIVAFSIALAAILIEADSTGSDQWLGRWPRLFGADAAGARAMLSTIAGSMMTVVGITFSMTLVTLALTSSQYSSRILRNFIRDRVTQVVLGVFAGIFTYCLIVLRTIRGGDETGFVASVAVSVGVVLAIGGIGVLIFFIHHIASSIQASSIIASVADETLGAVDRLFPGRLGQEPGKGDGDQALPPPLPQHWQTIPAERNGYVESVANTLLLNLAREHRTIVRMERGIGQFGLQGRDQLAESIDIRGVQANHVAVRYENPVRCTEPSGLHGPLDPALELDRLESSVKQAGGRPLEEALEEPLQGGEWTHGRARSLAEGSAEPVRHTRWGDRRSGTIVEPPRYERLGWIGTARR